MNEILQSTNKTIWETYPYLSLTEYLVRMINNIHNEKEGLVEYTEILKQEKSIVKSSIRDNLLDIFVENN